MAACRLIIDAPAPGPWNMAVDEALLHDAVDHDIATLRLYQWSNPTLSLGYFQRYDDRYRHAASRECAVVRRQTGGGAILHDRELTYSLTLPANNPLTRDATAIYTAVHQTFVRLLEPRLKASGVAGRLRLNCVDSPHATDDEPFLCFERRARGDLLLELEPGLHETKIRQLAYKILGSAQRRHRGAILQHGSLLLAQSSAAPELLGWQDLVGGSLWPDDFSSLLPQELEPVVTSHWTATALPPTVCDAAHRIEKARYSDSSWTRRR